MDVCYIDWHVTPFRADRWYEVWEAGAARAMAFGAKSWEDRADFERYWYSDEVAALREQAINYYAKPLLPTWHSLIAAE